MLKQPQTGMAPSLLDLRDLPLDGASLHPARVVHRSFPQQCERDASEFFLSPILLTNLLPAFEYR
jgi:hypothetical protein